MSMISELAMQCSDKEYKQFMDAVFMQQEKKTIWTADKLAKLRREYKWKNTAQLARELEIDTDRVRWRANLMGLKKDSTMQVTSRMSFLDKIMSEYVYETAPQLAKKYNVRVTTVRGWIAEARHGRSLRGKA